MKINIDIFATITFSISVPSAPPTLVNITKVSSAMIEVQWKPVNCTQHNGKIIYYLVRYEALGNNNITTVTGEQTTITNLMSSTTYSIKVAAVNSAGTGEFSSAIMAVTKPSEYNVVWF